MFEYIGWICVLVRIGAEKVFAGAFYIFKRGFVFGEILYFRKCFYVVYPAGYDCFATWNFHVVNISVAFQEYAEQPAPERIFAHCQFVLCGKSYYEGFRVRKARFERKTPFVVHIRAVDSLRQPFFVEYGRIYFVFRRQAFYLSAYYIFRSQFRA